MKKILLGLGIITTVFACASCSEMDFESNKPANGEIIENGTVDSSNQGNDSISNSSVKLSNQNIEKMSMQAISSIDASMSIMSSRAKLSVAEEIDAIELMQKAEVLLASSLNIEEQEPTKEEYVLQYKVTYSDKEYIMYIQDYKVEEEQEEDEQETTIKYHGVVAYDENEYPFTAKKSTETEENETEEEIEFELIYGENSKVTIENEYEVEGTETEESFKYTVIENGIKKDTYKVKKSLEDNKREMKIEKNGTVLKYRFYEEDSIEYLEVSNKELNTKVLYKKVVTEDTVSYEIVE